MSQDVRFVTPEEFDDLLSIVNAHVGRTVHAGVVRGSRGPIEPWLPLALRTLFATGCRPSEIMGTPGRIAKRIAQGRNVPSTVKPHHGLRARDVLGQHRLYVAGKHTHPERQTEQLKPRIVLCADADVYRDLQRLAEQRTAEGGREQRLFAPDANDGKARLLTQMKRLKPLLPARLRGFSARWLRHSHAIHAIRSGVDLMSLRQQLGHTSLEVTAIYLRFAGVDERRYLDAFSGRTGPTWETRSCPSCAFEWREDPKTGAFDLGSRVGVALRRPRTR